MIKVRQIKIEIEKDNHDELKRKISKKLKIKIDDIIDFKISKKSIDARDKNNVHFVYEVILEIKNKDNFFKKSKSKDISKYEEIKYKTPRMGEQVLRNRPVIVGSGPSGLFAALILAEAGYKPLIIERGESVEKRVTTVEEFWNSGKLNPNSNVCFGEGGAGTFSDGKLNTLTKDSCGRMPKVFNTFVEAGAPEKILYENNPHIGTDLLIDVLIGLRNKIISLGGEFLFDTKLTDIVLQDDVIKAIEINNNESIETEVLILAIGHSARETYQMLYDYGIKMTYKKFAVGVRIQHPQDMINRNQYGSFHKYLPAANYKLTYKAKNTRGVYSFCMCPGGYVVNSSTEEAHMVINGMSYHNRDSGIANSAIIVEVDPEDYGYYPLEGLAYQKKLENMAFRKGEGKIPVQLLGDYFNNRTSTSFGNIKPMIKGEYQFANLNEIFPFYINEALKEALVSFEKKIKGFTREDAIIAGIETRTSSAVRINRDESFESSTKGIYPTGEGSGYAGGIITSAIDGIKVAEKIIEKYKNML